MASVMGGYWASWSSVGGNFDASAINSMLFTHLFCAFAQLITDTNELSIPNECLNFPNIVKKNKSDVKALISIGGGAIESNIFNNMASNQDSRTTFIQSCIQEARNNNFDGIDLDWENQSTKEEMDNLENLLTEFKAAINLEASNTNKSPLLLTAALAYTSTIYNDDGDLIPYPTQAITESLDWINVMAYDFYNPSRPGEGDQTRPHSALYVPQSDPNSKLSGSQGIEDWINSEVPASKLVLGLPFYGYAWKLKDPNDNGILAPASGADDSFFVDGQPSYNQVRAFIDENGAQEMYNDEYVTNYCYSKNTWITYDDKEAISTKVKYAKDRGLLGYFAWDLNHDLIWDLSKEAFQAWET